MKHRTTFLSSMALPANASFRRCVVSACTAGAVFAAPVRAVDKMNGVGRPLLFLCVIAVTIFAARHLLWMAVALDFAGTASCLRLVVALGNMVLSVCFFFFTTAFNYVLVSTVLA
ncbi:hypothetical protein TraAM80_10349 [Trypanosoma rangeli]|uniref:Uncharacterized protein n=1 Tax=Trypanosoma rangeli TaxID=5698 RepID=A0A422MPR5_TRYRA|nr:uncharacterized protein TraAM80_10349 [Trypanosoma rangeli]RNE95194.1 hypothetical protein TraAM80_10349 [Trypanosoma rangeli]|eukprot:RNE95194.1 hypothetical protein TraAM80_10349 [Trypanosoma rangeli]